SAPDRQLPDRPALQQVHELPRARAGGREPGADGERHPLPGPRRHDPPGDLAPALLLHPVPRAAGGRARAGKEHVPGLLQRAARRTREGEGQVIGKLLERARHWWGVSTRLALHLSLGFLTIGGFIMGVIFWGGFNTAMEMTNREPFCV